MGRVAFTVELTGVTEDEATQRMNAIKTLLAGITPGAGEDVVLTRLDFQADGTDLDLS